MGNTFYFGFEVLVMEWIQETLGTIGVSFFSFLTYLGESGVIVAFIAVFYLGFDKELGKMIGVNAACAGAWNPLIKNIALRRRPYFDNPGVKCLKPVSEGDIYDISAQGYSFPSGHSMSSAAAYGSLPLGIAGPSKPGTAKPGSAKINPAERSGLKSDFRKPGGPEPDVETKAALEPAEVSYISGKRKVAWAAATILPILVGLSRVALGVHYPTDVAFGWIAGWGIAFGLTEIQRRVKNEKLLHLILFLITLPGVFYCHTEDYYSALGVMIGFFISLHFEKRFVDFKPVRTPWKVLPRLAGAGLLFLGLNNLFKLPFDDEFLASDIPLAFLVRTVRYALVIFIIMGIYPMTFKWKILE